MRSFRPSPMRSPASTRNFPTSPSKSPWTRSRRGWGDYVTKVIGEFNAGTASDVYGTAIETFQAFSSRGLWLGLNDFVAANSGFSDFATQPVRARLVQGGDPVHPDQLEQHHDQLQPRPFRQGQGRLSQAGLDLGGVPRGRQGAHRQGQLRQRHAVRLRSAEPEFLRAALVLQQRHRRAQGRLDGVRTCSTRRSPRACSSCTT